MFSLLCVILIGYLCYKDGFRNLLQSRIRSEEKVEHTAYVMFMTAGTVIGNFVTHTFLHYLQITERQPLVLCGTLSSIMIGEAFYAYNKRLIRRIPSLQQRKNE